MAPNLGRQKPGTAMHATFEDIRPTRLIEQPKRRRLRRRGVSPGTAAIVAILFAAALVLLAGREAAPVAPPLPATVTAPPPDWTDIQNPLELYDLSAPEFAHGPQSYAARRNRFGGRQDILTFGALDGRSPFFRLTLYRLGGERAVEVPLFVGLVRLAAAADLSILRSANLTILPTRFGPVETADIDLTAGDAAPVPCLGFRGAGLDGYFRLGGFACGTRAAPITRPALACLLDRLELDGGGDPALAGFFAASELRRDSRCVGSALGPDTKTDWNWIDENDAPPPLKLRKMH
ncbi:MAG: hypothetical protein AB1508_09590 [Pseudomonadota bacterium]